MFRVGSTCEEDYDLVEDVLPEEGEEVDGVTTPPDLQRDQLSVRPHQLHLPHYTPLPTGTRDSL